MDRPIGLRSDDFHWFQMICDDLRWFPVSPDLVWPSGSDLEWQWTGPDPALDRIGSDWTEFGADRSGFGSAWVGFGSDPVEVGTDWVGFGSHWVGVGSKFDRIWIWLYSQIIENSMVFPWFYNVFDLPCFLQS